MRGPGDCETAGDITALVVTARNRKDIEHPNLPQYCAYSTMILACDKDLCGGTPECRRFQVIYTFDNTGELTKRHPLSG